MLLNRKWRVQIGRHFLFITSNVLYSGEYSGAGCKSKKPQLFEVKAF